MEEGTASGVENPELSQKKHRVGNKIRSEDGINADQGDATSPAPDMAPDVTPGPSFSISDDESDSFHNNKEFHLLGEDGEKRSRKSYAGDVPAPVDSDLVNSVANENISTAVGKAISSPSKPILNDVNKTLDGMISRSNSTQRIAGGAKNPLSLPQFKQGENATSPESSVTTKVIFQSRRSQSSPAEERDESVFGPFVEPVVNSDWNPFGEKDIAPGEFHVDDDILGESKSNGPYERKPSKLCATQSQEAELDDLRRVFDSEYERALEDREISWRARYGATRLSFIMSALLMVVYLWLGCMFYRSEAGWSVPDALLFTVYTVTTVGYGGPQPLPNTAAFHAFTSMYVLVGISLVTVLGAHTYQLVTLEATRIRSSPWRRQTQSQEFKSRSNDFSQEALTREMDKYRHQFMNELEDLVRERPVLDATLVKVKEFQIFMRTTKWGRVLSVALPFLGMIFLGAIVVGIIEDWSPLESIYWSIVTLTTVGYGDYVPTKNSSVWFCTLFFIPSSLFFLSFFLAHVAKSYIRLHAIHVTRIERKMRRKNECRRAEAERAEKAKRNIQSSALDNTNFPSESTRQGSPGGSVKVEDTEKGFHTTVISYEEEDLHNSPTKSSGLFGDQASIVDDVHNNDPLSSKRSPTLRYRENVIRNKETVPDQNGNRVVSFAQALQSLNRHSQSSRKSDKSTSLEYSTAENQGVNKPSLEVRLRVQARLARIIAEEVAGYQTGVVIKGSTVSLTIGSLRDTADKWKIPSQAWKAFRAVAFRSLLFVGERELISDGGDALLRLNVVEFHQIFSPMLAAMGDGSAMEAWLAATDVLADVELRGAARYSFLGKGKHIFNGKFT